MNAPDIVDFGAVIDAAANLMDTQFRVYGFPLSYFNVWLFSIAAVIVGVMLVRFFLDK